MENGVQALKIASGMIIFVLAISISISAFTQASQAMKRIWEIQQTEESYVTDADGNYLNYVDFDIDNGTRKVGVETIIPNMYRAYKENFTIFFWNKNGEPFELYKNEDNEIINHVDLILESHGNPSDALKQLELRLKENDNKLYKKLANNTFVEYLGEYYQDDVKGETDTAEVNKTKKRVIVYIQE